MIVPVMQIRIMRVLVPHWFVPMPVRVRFGNRPIMVMLVMIVVQVDMVVFQNAMAVLMVVPLGQMQIEAEGHENACTHQLPGNSVPENGYREHRADEGGQGEIGARARCAEMPQCQHEHD